MRAVFAGANPDRVGRLVTEQHALLATYSASVPLLLLSYVQARKWIATSNDGQDSKDQFVDRSSVETMIVSPFASSPLLNAKTVTKIRQPVACRTVK